MNPRHQKILVTILGATSVFSVAALLYFGFAPAEELVTGQINAHVVSPEVDHQEVEKFVPPVNSEPTVPVPEVDSTEPQPRPKTVHEYPRSFGGTMDDVYGVEAAALHKKFMRRIMSARTSCWQVGSAERADMVIRELASEVSIDVAAIKNALERLRDYGLFYDFTCHVEGAVVYVGMVSNVEFADNTAKLFLWDGSTEDFRLLAEVPDMIYYLEPRMIAGNFATLVCGGGVIGEGCTLYGINSLDGAVTTLARCHQEKSDPFDGESQYILDTSCRVEIQEVEDI